VAAAAAVRPAFRMPRSTPRVSWVAGKSVLIGLQADADAAGIRGGSSCFPQVPNVPQSCTTKIDALGTVTARFGAAFDRTLYYVLGGFAWEHERLNNPGR
jgi:hypothetical protein